TVLRKRGIRKGYAKAKAMMMSLLTDGPGFLVGDEDWHTIASNTNGVESQHQKAYTEGGQFVSLLEAVKSGQYIDDNSLAKYYNYCKTGKRDRYRDTTAEGRENLSQMRHGKLIPCGALALMR
ncbi:hypothetical protein E4U19_000288, partial [Claviceps sp. Clav32 group G5]